MQDPNLHKPILPAFFFRPFSLIWTTVLPQIVLIILNLYSYQLIAGEMDPGARNYASILLGIQILIMGFAVTLCVLYQKRSKLMDWKIFPGTLVLHITYLWLTTSWIHQIIPFQARTWILPPETVLYHQYALTMPGLFYSLLYLACVPLGISRKRDTGLTFLTLLLIPGLWYLFGVMSWKVFGTSRFHMPEIIFFIFLVGSTLLILLGLIRLVATLYSALADRHQGRFGMAVLTILIALAGPVGGLILNQTFPFPCDFQCTEVYILAVLNGLCLLIVFPIHDRRSDYLWTVQCLFYPFTLYFFIVFLPFAPLSFLAMIVLGAGFLMLVPIALFILHTYKLIEGFSGISSRFGKRKSIFLGALFFSLSPLYFALNTCHDKVVLNRAIEFVFEPDYQNSIQFNGSKSSIRRGLTHLQEFKKGLQLPFISDIYRQIVFGGLVLPDEKMHLIHRVFFGEDLPPPQSRENFLFYSQGTGSRSEPSFRPRSTIPNDVHIQSITTQSQTLTDCTRTRVILQIKSNTASQSEFQTSIHLPPGVFVSGYWLHIGKEKVPGRIFEKKAALWVYDMIRNTRRDPGLLYYRDEDSLELKIFPFIDHEERTTEIEFIFPTNLNPKVEIGNSSVALNPKKPQSNEAVLIFDRGMDQALILPKNVLKSLPSKKRTPYLHFIVDRSLGSDVSLKRSMERIKIIASRFPEAKKTMITLGNYQWTDLTEKPIARSELDRLDLQSIQNQIKPEGGFRQDFAIKRALLQFKNSFSLNPEFTNEFPILIVIRNSLAEAIREEHLSYFSNLLPDLNGFFLSNSGEDLTSHTFDSSQTITQLEQYPVTDLKFENQSLTFRTGEPRDEVISLASTLPSTSNQIFSSSGSSIPILRIQDRTYRKAFSSWNQFQNLIHTPRNPQLRRQELMESGRSSGILNPMNSYIVVENSSQWEILKRAEKNKLENKEILEFTNTPEPSLGWMLLILGVFFWFRNKLRKPIELQRLRAHLP